MSPTPVPSTAAGAAGEQVFHRLLEKLPAGAYTCDATGLITYFNARATEMWGRSPALNDPADRYCGSFKLFAADGTPIRHDQCWMAMALTHDNEFNGREIVVERPDGSRVTALAHANPVHDEEGRLVGAVNVLVDISERKQAEDALREADRSKDEFLATLAHELRNPLAPLRNAFHLLKRDAPANPETLWAMQVVDRQLRQMTRLIDDLMDIARITRNRVELRVERVLLADVMRQAIETSRPLLETSGSELTVTTPPGVLELDADPTRLAQALSNLLNNAAKFTDRGGKIAMIAERCDREVTITVRDSGIGITADLLPRVFDMFAQGDRSLERSQGGLGIGLTLVKRIVELHGGGIEARSDGPGTGSEFVVRLPIAGHASKSESPGRIEAPPKSVSRTIVVVDDSRDATLTLSLLLEGAGHRVGTANDGVEATRVIDELVPDVVVLDIGLPGMNGYDAARWIRRQPWGARPVLIAMTGWGQESDRARSRAAGFDYHLVKPVDPADLIALIGTLPVPERNGDQSHAGETLP